MKTLRTSLISFLALVCLSQQVYGFKRMDHREFSQVVTNAKGVSACVIGAQSRNGGIFTRLECDGKVIVDERAILVRSRSSELGFISGFVGIMKNKGLTLNSCSKYDSYTSCIFAVSE